MEALIEQSKKRIKDLENEIDKEKETLKKHLKDSDFDICETCKFDIVTTTCNACNSNLCSKCSEDFDTSYGLYIVCKGSLRCKHEYYE
jgi:hypothetical protein